MSSGYKIKGHQRSRSAKPYERKSGLVNRVKEWLTPSSWLGGWNKSSNDATIPPPPPPPIQLGLEQRLGGPTQSGDVPSSSAASHSASPLFVPKPGALRNPFLSNPMALLVPPGSEPGPSGLTRTLGEAPPTSVGVVEGSRPQSTSNAIHSNTGMELRLQSSVGVPLSLRSSGVPSRPTSMGNTGEDSKMADDFSSKDSEGSWVAEDDGSMEQEEGEAVTGTSSERGQSLERLRTKSFPTSLNLSGKTELERSSEVYTYELGEGSAGVVQPAACVTPVVITEAEQVILHMENPAKSSPPPFSSSSSSSPHTTPPATATVATSSADARRTMLSSSLLNRLYTTNPFAMSTPQLSPVHETREDVHQESGVAPKLPVSHSGSDRNSSSRFHSQASILSSATADSSLPLPAMSTPSKFHTEESLKRSPFRSSFYSGRTSFGGAASGQKPRVKRPRSESSPPVVTPLRLSVTARPASSAGGSGSKGHHGLVASQTARKIMESLGNLSSPLTTARKLPMRATPLLGETQLAKRRRVSLDAGMSSGNGVLSPPPITPLRTPSSQPSRSNTETQIVPSEKSIRSRQHQPPSTASRVTEDSGYVNSGHPAAAKMAAPPRPPPPPPPTSTALPSLSSSSFPSASSGGKPPVFTMPDFSSTQPPKPSAILSGLKFSAPPFSMKPVDHQTEDQERNRSPPSDSQRGFNLTGNEAVRSFLSQARKNLGSGGGGKMRTKHSYRKRGAPEGEEEEEEEGEDVGYINPMAQPPAVGLTLGKGGTLPKFLFHTQLPTSKPQDTVPTSQASSSSLAAPLSTTSITPAPSFAFSAPKSVASESGPPPAAEQLTKQAAKFDFSAPKDHRTPPPPNFSSSSTSKPLTTTFKPSVPPTLTSLPNPSPFSPSSTLSITNRLKEQPKTVQPSPPPPLKAISVEEALKSPEFQLPLSRTSVMAPALTKPAKQEVRVCIDLTDSDDEKEPETKPAEPAVASTGQRVGSGGLQLGSSGGLQLGSGGLKLGTSGGLQLGSNSTTAGMSTISGARSVLPMNLGVSVSASEPSTSLKLKTDPPSVMPPLKPLSQFAPPSGSWECSQCMVQNQAKDDKCVACTAPRPSTSKTDTTLKSTVPSFKPLAQFAPPSGSWECDQCMVSNKPTDRACVACGAPKPVKNGSTTASSAGASSLGAPAGFGATVEPPLPAGGSWSCDMCLVQNKAEDSKCIACTAPKPGGNRATLSEAPPTSTAAANWTCGTCLVVNKAEDVNCVACSGPKVAKPSLSGDLKSQKLPSKIVPLTGFAPPAGSWTCDTCLVQNKAEDTKCVSCSTQKPGAKPVSESDSGSKKPSTSGGLTMGASGGLKLGGGLVLSSGGSFGQGGLKLLGSGGGKESQVATAGAGSGGVKIGVSLSSLVPGKSDKKSAPELSKQGGGGSSSSNSGGVIGLSSVSGSTPASSSGSGQASIAQLPEKNPLAGIKFGVTATPTSTAASSQNPLAGIKFGAPTASTTSAAATASSLQINFGTSSSSSSPFKLGGGVTESSGLKIGGALSSSPSSFMDTGGGAAAPKLGGILGGAQPTISSTPAANPLAGLKFGVSATTQLSSSSSGSSKLQLPTSQPQLQFGSMAAASTASSSGLFGLSSSTTTTSTSSQSSFFASSTSSLSGSTPSPFVFSGASKPDSGNNQPPLIQFGATQGSQLQPAAPPALNSILGGTTSTSTTSASSSLFVFSGGKDTSKIDSSSPFPNAGSASGSLGGFGAAGGIGMGTGSGTGLGGGAQQPLKLNFGASQPASNQPFVFGGSSNSSSGAGQQPSAPGLSLPQMQGSIFGAQSSQQQQQSQQPQFNFGSATQATQPPPPSFNFSAGSGGLGGMGSTPNRTPQLGFPPSNAGGLNFAAAPPSMTGSQGTGLGAGIGQNSATSSSSADNSNNNKQLQQGFQFNPNAGVNFNFGVGQGGGMAPMGSGDASNLLFSAGSAQASSSPSSSRVIKKARRRKA